MARPSYLSGVVSVVAGVVAFWYTGMNEPRGALFQFTLPGMES